MFLIDVLDQVMMERDLAKITEGQYKKSITEYSDYLGRKAEISDLSYDTINKWLKSLKGRLEPTTIVNRKKGLTVVWNHLAEIGKAEFYQSRRLFTPKIEDEPVIAWTVDEFAILLRAACYVQGVCNGVPLSDLLRAWLWVGLDTAYRPSDIRLMKWTQIDFLTGTVTLSQHKTNNVHRACLGAESIKSLKRIMYPERKLVLPITKDQMRYPLEKLYAEAKKIGFIKTPGRSIGTLRRLHATLQYEEHGADVAAESLGHVGGTRTVLKSYIDHRSRRQGRLPTNVKLKELKSRESAG